MGIIIDTPRQNLKYTCPCCKTEFKKEIEADNKCAEVEEFEVEMLKHLKSCDKNPFNYPELKKCPFCGEIPKLVITTHKYQTKHVEDYDCPESEALTYHPKVTYYDVEKTEIKILCNDNSKCITKNIKFKDVGFDSGYESDRKEAKNKLTNYINKWNKRG